MTLLTDDAAHSIYQEMLDLIRDAMDTQRYDLYQTYFALPHRIETSTGIKILHNDADLKKFFDTLCANLLIDGNSEMVRRCVAATFEDARTIHGSHETRVVGHAAQISDSYPAFSVLRLIDGQWRVASAQYATQPIGLVENTLRKLP